MGFITKNLHSFRVGTYLFLELFRHYLISCLDLAVEQCRRQCVSRETVSLPETVLRRLYWPSRVVMITDKKVEQLPERITVLEHSVDELEQENQQLRQENERLRAKVR